MAWFTYVCEKHGDFTINLKKREKTQLCPNCGAECKCVLKPGTVRVTEIIDNGAMTKRVERLHNIDEIMEERNKKHKLKQTDEETE